MATELFDNATSPGTSTTLAVQALALDTVLNVRSPASLVLQQDGQFRCVLIDPTSGNAELVLVTGGQWSAQWQVVRGIEGSRPADFPVGTIVRHVLTAGALANLIAQGGVINPPTPGDIMEAPTVDTQQLFKVILFGSGKTLAIPANANPPAAPTGLSVDVHLVYVKLSWIAATGAATYTVYRNGVELVAGITALSYRDATVQIGQSYTYTVRAYDQYGQPGPLSAPSSPANINQSLDVAPNVKITCFPNPIPTGTPAVVRVCGKSLSGLQLSYLLSVNAGALQPTNDPSIWTLTP